MTRLFVLLATFVLASTTIAGTPLLMTKEGPAKGVLTAEGTFFANVPYATPPVGKLRWKAPRKPSARTSIWDGSRLDVKCAQLGAYFSGTTDDSQLGQLVGSEDCLYLNVWIPKTPAAKPRPVFVWYHGGSNRQGYAGDPLYDGAKLASALDAVVVSVNFRLGFFGALHHESLDSSDPADSSGNYVTLDALRALTWVRENASAMGADVSKITIAGESAGCVNVWGLILTPLAKGLFARAYCASGFPNSFPKSIAKDVSNGLIEQALIARGHARDADEAKKKRQDMSNEQLRKLLDSLTAREIVTFKPSYFPTQHIADGYVLPSESLAALGLGRYNRVPMIVSTTEDEGSYFYLKSYSKLAPLDLWRVLNGRAAPTNLETLVRSKDYAEYKSKSDKYTYGLDQLTDSFLVSGQLFMPKIYRLRWDWRSPREPWKSALMASHGIDLPFLFRTRDLGDRHFFSFLNPDLKTKEVADLSSRFLVYLKGFVHESDPNAYLSSGDRRWHQWYGGLPNNLVISQNEIDESYHFFNPIVGTYALTSAIYELYDVSH